MAASPHTPTSFVIFTLASAFTLGATWGALSSVTFACIGCEGAATKAALLGSFSNIPLAAAAASLIIYAAVARATEPTPIAAVAGLEFGPADKAELV